MGTNFYCRRKNLTKEQLEEIKKLANNEQIDDLQRVLQQYNVNKRYHIGKRSFGWAFLFQSGEGYVRVPWENLDELKNYISLPDVEIFDEYGDKFTPEQFWNEEIGDTLYPDEKHLDLEMYCIKNPGATREGLDAEYIEDGVRWSKNEFF